ncbi:M48 family metalloprotease, partial [Bacteriovoracaceae bacterium]|nr:M48 family metalloprotease [Bacteriovoracaceae bacterium]
DNLDNLEKYLQELTSTHYGRRSLLKAMPFLLVGCATKSTSNRHREGSNKGQKTSLSVKDEVKMTKEVLPKMQKDYPAHKSADAQRYISSLGQKIVRSSSLDGKPYRYTFTVVDVDQVNAFALPAGTVYVTAPLIKMAETEAELAGVVGHEVGHIQARHTAERMDVAKKEQTNSILYAIGGGVIGGLAGAALAKAVCKPKDRECMNRVVKYGALAGGAGGLLIQKYGFMANSREDEMEADRVGFRTSVAAGYHKDYVGNFYEKLLNMEKKHSGGGSGVLKSVADAMSTHPPSKERVTQMKQMAKKEKLGKNTLISSKDFDRIKKLV